MKVIIHTVLNFNTDIQYIFFLGLGTHDYETMKNVDDEKDLKKPYHSNEGKKL